MSTMMKICKMLLQRSYPPPPTLLLTWRPPSTFPFTLHPLTCIQTWLGGMTRRSRNNNCLLRDIVCVGKRNDGNKIWWTCVSNRMSQVQYHPHNTWGGFTWDTTPPRLHHSSTWTSHLPARAFYSLLHQCANQLSLAHTEFGVQKTDWNYDM